MCSVVNLAAELTQYIFTALKFAQRKKVLDNNIYT